MCGNINISRHVFTYQEIGYITHDFVKFIGKVKSHYIYYLTYMANRGEISRLPVRSKYVNLEITLCDDNDINKKKHEFVL